MFDPIEEAMLRIVRKCNNEPVEPRQEFWEFVDDVWYVLDRDGVLGGVSC